jgi:hypothetical protein
MVTTIRKNGFSISETFHETFLGRKENLTKSYAEETI